MNINWCCDTFSVLRMVVLIHQLWPALAHPASRDRRQTGPAGDSIPDCHSVTDEVLWLRLDPTLHSSGGHRDGTPAAAALTGSTAGVGGGVGRLSTLQGVGGSSPLSPDGAMSAPGMRTAGTGERTTFRLRHPRSANADSTSKNRRRHHKRKNSDASDRSSRSKTLEKLRSRLAKAAADQKSVKRLFKKKQWSCQFKPSWQQMDEGVFPSAISTGSCQQSHCMFGFYQCKPIQYPIPVLKRDPTLCHPLPTIGTNTTYEEAWHVVHVMTTVGCECARAGS